jgi:hypothetical protein
MALQTSRQNLTSSQAWKSTIRVTVNKYRDSFLGDTNDELSLHISEWQNPAVSDLGMLEARILAHFFHLSVRDMQSFRHEEGGVKSRPVEKQMQSPFRFQYPQSVGKQTIVICQGKRYTWLCFLQRRRPSHTVMQRSISYSLSQCIEQLFRNLCWRFCFQIRQLRRLAQGLMWDET